MNFYSILIRLAQNSVYEYNIDSIETSDLTTSWTKRIIELVALGFAVHVWQIIEGGIDIGEID